MTLLQGIDAANVADAIYARVKPGGTTLDGLETVMAAESGGATYRVVGRKDGETAAGLLGAKTGIVGLRSQSPFGVLMERSSPGGVEHVLVVRGTRKTSANDWLTNATVGLSPGPAGLISHMGFTKVYESLLPDLKTAVQSTGRISSLHVVGHSLGGAVATLLAAHFKDAGTSNVALYTFGAPRVLATQSNGVFEGMIGAENIRRVYSRCDPVPMIPIFPFAHFPAANDLLIDGRALISFDAHSMVTNYIPAIRGKGWPSRINGWEKFSADHWLDLADRNGSTPMSAFGAWALNMAISALLVALSGVWQFFTTGAMTLVDRLAALIQYGIDLGARLGDTVVRLLRTIAKFLGITLTIGRDIGAAVLRYLIGRFLTVLANMASMALQRLV